MDYPICTKPFEFMEISHGKGFPVYPCCEGWVKRGIGRLAEDSISDVWLGEAAIEFRKSVVDGSFRYCNRQTCPYLKNNAASRDTKSPIKWVSSKEKALYRHKALNPTQYLPAPKIVNLAYDRSCNLACPSCRTEIKQADANKREVFQAIGDDVIQAFGDKELILYITGSGDPFGSRHYWDLLTSEALENRENIKLILHTNATLVTAHRWEQIQHLQHRMLDVIVSVDGASKTTYEINRRPAKWEALLESMSLLSSVLQENPHIRMTLNYVVQKNNWHEIEAFYDLAKSWGAHHVMFSALNDWGTYYDNEGQNFYKQNAVQFSDNPEYSAFKAWLAQTPLRQKRDVSIDFD